MRIKNEMESVRSLARNDPTAVHVQMVMLSAALWSPRYCSRLVPVPGGGDFVRNDTREVDINLLRNEFGRYSVSLFVFFSL